MTTPSQRATQSQKGQPQYQEWELDAIWRSALDGENPPDAIVCLNDRLQRAAQEVMDAQDELRDWARMKLAEELTSKRDAKP